MKRIVYFKDLKLVYYIEGTMVQVTVNTGAGA
jgi:hypothetical protein